MLTKNFCKSCFKSIVDSTASDKFLMMSGNKHLCPSCEQKKEVVASYFKYGEHVVTADGRHTTDQARYVGVNPNYTFWGKCYPYADVENYKGQID